MPYERIKDLPQLDGPICVHLRSKAMMVTGEIRPRNIEDTDHQDCWCNLTQRPFGPDTKFATLIECGPARSCFRETR